MPEKKLVLTSKVMWKFDGEILLTWEADEDRLYISSQFLPIEKALAMAQAIEQCVTKMREAAANNGPDHGDGY